MHFDLPFNFVVYLLVCIVSLAAAVWLIGSSVSLHTSGARRLVLALRLAVVLLALVILAGPARDLRRTESARTAKTALLIDTSGSMALGHRTARIDEVREIVAPVLAEEETAGAAGIAMFADTLDLTGFNSGALPDRNPAGTTNLGQALAAIVEAAPEIPVRNIVVFSDGRAADRDQLMDAVAAAHAADLPISVYTAGLGESLVNLAITQCLVDRHVTPATRLPVRIVMQMQGVDGEPLTVSVKDPFGKTVRQEQITARNGESEAMLVLDVGRQSGQFTVELSPLPDELTTEDNQFEFHVTVIDPTIRILYMEGSNHPDVIWGRDEYLYLKEAFEASGKMEVDVLTIDTQEASGGKLFRIDDPERGYPTTRDELFAYDLVICSDINLSIFTPEQLQWTVDLVAERGGGFCMIGGYTAFGAGGWDKTVWEKMIPMDMQTSDAGYVTEEFVPVFPDDVRDHPILQLDADPARAARILAVHPRFKGTNLVNRAKPAATTLAMYEERGMPIICVQAYGKGRSMAFTSDAAGGWGDYYQTEWGADEKDNRHYQRFWVNTARWLTANSIAHRSRRLTGNSDAVTYSQGETIPVRARFLSAGTGGLRLSAWLDGAADNAKVPLRMNTDTGEFDGVVRLPATFADTEATIVFAAESTKSGEIVATDELTVRVQQLDHELSDLTPDPELMAQVARITGGRVIETTDELAAVIESKVTTTASGAERHIEPLWDSPWLWALLIALLSSEWIVRRVVRYAK
ncbi:MAG: glutamine amidotransferase [Lentisphaeria bacterium]